MKTFWTLVRCSGIVTIIAIILSSMFPASAVAWTRLAQDPSHAETVIGEVFCGREPCSGSGYGSFTREEWQEAIRHAVSQWNSIGGYGYDLLDIRSMRPGEDPCVKDGAVSIIFTKSSGYVCDGHRLRPGYAATAFTVPPVIYVNSST